VAFTFYYPSLPFVFNHYSSAIRVQIKKGLKDLSFYNVLAEGFTLVADKNSIRVGYGLHLRPL
jgi:hypothetical protein